MKSCDSSHIGYLKLLSLHDSFPYFNAFRVTLQNLSDRIHRNGPSPDQARSEALPENRARVDPRALCRRVGEAGRAAAAALAARPRGHGGLLWGQTSEDS